MGHKFGTMRTGSCTNRLHTHGYITTTHTCNAEHSQNPSHDPHSLTPTVSQSTFAACTASMCVFFVQSILTTGCHSDEQTVEYTYTFLIYTPHPDSTLHRCFSPLFPSFFFLQQCFYSSPHHHSANFTGPVSLPQFIPRAAVAMKTYVI